MPTFSQIANNTASTTIAWGSLVISVDYFPSHITEKTIATAQSFNIDDPVSAFGTVNELLVDLVKSWDLTEDDGTTMYPLSENRLADLPVMFRVQCLRDIIGAMRPESMAAQS